MAGVVAAASTAVAIWVMPVSVPHGATTPDPLTPDEAYALAALGRAGERVVLALDRNHEILERVIERQQRRNRQ
jgi:hypothetical protein